MYIPLYTYINMIYTLIYYYLWTYIWIFVSNSFWIIYNIYIYEYVYSNMKMFMFIQLINIYIYSYGCGVMLTWAAWAKTSITMISFEISHGYTFTKQLQYQISFVCVVFLEPGIATTLLQRDHIDQQCSRSLRCHPLRPGAMRPFPRKDEYTPLMFEFDIAL